MKELIVWYSIKYIKDSKDTDFTFSVNLIIKIKYRYDSKYVKYFKQNEFFTYKQK